MAWTMARSEAASRTRRDRLGQIAQAAMDHLRRTAAGSRSEIAGLDQATESPHGRVARHARPGDPAADHGQIEHLASSAANSAARFLRSSPVDPAAGLSSLTRMAGIFPHLAFGVAMGLDQAVRRNASASMSARSAGRPVPGAASSAWVHQRMSSTNSRSSACQPAREGEPRAAGDEEVSLTRIGRPLRS